MNILPEQIIIGAGTEYLYQLLLQLFPGDALFCLENPGYPKLSTIYRENHRALCYADLDQEGIRMDTIKRLDPQILHISPTHHFPTGKVTSIARRYELLNWAHNNVHRYIIEDDYDSEFRLNGRLIPTLASIDQTQSVIYMNTFSKSLASTIRISYMVLPLPLLTIFKTRLSYLSSTVSNFEQYTLAKFIRDGYFERHINRMRTYYKKHRKAIS